MPHGHVPDDFGADDDPGDDPSLGADDLVLAGLLRGDTLHECSAFSGVSRNRIKELLMEPEFRRRLTLLRRNRLRRIADRLTDAVVAATDRVITQVVQNPEADDRTVIRALQVLEVASRQWTELITLDERLAQLEAAEQARTRMRVVS